MHKTTMPKPEQVAVRWILVDADDKILGRLASQVATLLMGKNKPHFSRHLNLGDHVIVINVAKLRVTGKKLQQKQYFHYTGYPGGLKAKTLGTRLLKEPEKLFQESVRGMLPKNRLGRQMLAHLHPYRGNQHNHQAQKPVIYPIS